MSTRSPRAEHNARPAFSKGARVTIIRHRHGWCDGQVAGEVTSVMPRSGGSAGYIVRGDDGTFYEIPNTRDLRPAG